MDCVNILNLLASRCLIIDGAVLAQKELGVFINDGATCSSLLFILFAHITDCSGIVFNYPRRYRQTTAILFLLDNTAKYYTARYSASVGNFSFILANNQRSMQKKKKIKYNLLQ